MADDEPIRFRVTVRADDIELRGYIDSVERLYELSNALRGIALVVASPATVDYNPFHPEGYDPSSPFVRGQP